MQARLGVGEETSKLTMPSSLNSNRTRNNKTSDAINWPKLTNVGLLRKIVVGHPRKNNRCGQTEQESAPYEPHIDDSLIFNMVPLIQIGQVSIGASVHACPRITSA